MENTKLSPWDFLKAINDTKEDIMADGEHVKDYVPFIINRGLSYFPDTVHYANEMNQYSQLDNTMQFSYLKESVRKRKRFSKWAKPEKLNNLQVIIEFYQVSKAKAISMLSILTPEEIEQIKDSMSQGGRV